MSESMPLSELVDHRDSMLRLFEEGLESTTRTRDELRKRAGELREEAASTDILGHREAALTLANRYERAAAARFASR